MIRALRFVAKHKILSLQMFALLLAGLLMIPPQPNLAKLNDSFAAVNAKKQPNRMPVIDIPAYPKRKFSSPVPSLTAKAFLIQDLNSRVIMASLNPHKRLPMASLTKLMTTLVALEAYQPKQIIAIKVDSDTIDGQTIGLKRGEKYTLESLVASSIISSANDAAINLAAAYPGGIKSFVQLMNQKAKQLNMSDTHFTNPVGYDNDNHYTSVFDLAILSRQALDNPLILAFAQSPMMRIVEVSRGRVTTLKTTNDLLGNTPGILGLKTGWTEKAGECLISLAESRDNYWFLVIVLNSQDRFGETLQLKQWVDLNYDWQPIKLFSHKP